MPKDKVKNKDLIVGFRWRSMRDYFTITGFASLLDVKYVCVSSALVCVPGENTSKCRL